MDILQEVSPCSIIEQNAFIPLIFLFRFGILESELMKDNIIKFQIPVTIIFNGCHASSGNEGETIVCIRYQFSDFSDFWWDKKFHYIFDLKIVENDKSHASLLEKI